LCVIFTTDNYQYTVYIYKCTLVCANQSMMHDALVSIHTLVFLLCIFSSSLAKTNFNLYSFAAVKADGSVVTWYAAHA
jgi:hypothetical protein